MHIVRVVNHNKTCQSIDCFWNQNMKFVWVTYIMISGDPALILYVLHGPGIRTWYAHSHPASCSPWIRLYLRNKKKTGKRDKPKDSNYPATSADIFLSSVTQSHGFLLKFHYPDSKVYGGNMRPTWGRQDPGGCHVGPMNFAIWVAISYSD